MVKIDWILGFNDEIRTNLFKNDIYKETLKGFILDGNISKSDKKYLMKYL